MTSPPSGAARFFFDANMIGVGRALARAIPGIVYPGHHDWPFAQGEDDRVWLAYVGDRGWCVIMRDKKIRTRATERAALEAHHVRAVVVATRKNLTIADNVSLLQTHWDDIRTVVAAPAALYHLTLRGLRRMVTY